MLGAVKLTINGDTNKYPYSWFGIGVDSRLLFLFPDSNWGKKVIIFGVVNSSLVHTDNKKKDAGLTQGLDSTTISAEAKYYINSLRSRRKFCLSLHYSGNNHFIC